MLRCANNNEWFGLGLHVQNDRLRSFLYNSGSFNPFSPMCEYTRQNICLASPSPWMYRTVLLLHKESWGCVHVAEKPRWSITSMGLKSPRTTWLTCLGFCGSINQGHRWADTKDQNDWICLFHSLTVLPQHILDCHYCIMQYFLKFLFIVITYWRYMCLNRCFYP